MRLHVEVVAPGLVGYVRGGAQVDACLRTLLARSRERGDQCRDQPCGEPVVLCEIASDEAWMEAIRASWGILRIPLRGARTRLGSRS